MTIARAAELSAPAPHGFGDAATKGITRAEGSLHTGKSARVTDSSVAGDRVDMGAALALGPCVCPRRDGRCRAPGRAGRSYQSIRSWKSATATPHMRTTSAKAGRGTPPLAST